MHHEAAQQIIHWGRYAFERGLITACSGNMSIRLDGDAFAITATGASLGTLTAHDVVECSIDPACPTKGEANGKRPSMETDMHRRLMRKLPEATAVFHASPLYTTLVACTSLEIPLNVIPEEMAYISRVVRVPYRHAGSRELAELVESSLEINELGLLENHGMIAAARTMAEAVRIAETFEFLAQLVCQARAASLELKVLPDEVRTDFLRHLREMRAAAATRTMPADPATRHLLRSPM